MNIKISKISKEVKADLKHLALNCTSYDEYMTTIEEEYTTEEQLAIGDEAIYAIWEQANPQEVTDEEWKKMEEGYLRWKSTGDLYR